MNKNAWTGLLAVCCALLLGLRIFLMNRGATYFDEMYYLFTYMQPDLYTISVTGTGHLIHQLFDWLQLDMLAYRYVHLALDLLGSGIFFAGFYAWYRKNAPENNRFWTVPALFLFLLIGNLVSGFRYPQCVSYYSLTNFFQLCIGAGLLSFLASDSKKQTLWSLLAAGVATGLVGFVRFPTAILIGVVSLGLILWQQRSAWWAYGLGVLLGVGFYFGLIQSPDSFVQQYLPVYQMMSQGSHPLGDLLKTYGIAFLTLFTIFIKYGGWVLILAVLGARRWPILVWAFPILITALCVINRFYYPYATHVKLFWVFIASALLWALPTVRNAKLAPGLLLLFVLPWLSAFGTNMDILLVMYTAILPWFALFAVLLDYIQQPKAACIRGGLILTLLGFVFVHAWYEQVSVMSNPLYQDQRLATKAMPEIPRLRNIQVTPHVRGYLLAIKSTLDRAGYQKGDSLLTYHFMPGLAYLFEATPFGSGYYLMGQRFDRENCFYLKHMGPHTALPKFIITLFDPTPAFQKCIAETGVNLTRDYQFVADIPTPSSYHSDDGRAPHPPIRILKRKSQP